jgi:8-oxo-dGTP pyrophosphatase MutT (NUDIX family)
MRVVSVRDLPAPPHIAVDVVRDRSATSSALGGFLDVRRLDLVVRYPDGTASAPFPYDVAVRAALDVAAIVAHYVEAGVRYVYLRSAVRPALALRDSPAHEGTQWEIPAGLIDPGETHAEAAARELEEELGVRMEASAMVPLGPPSFPVSGMCAEMHVYFHVEVDPHARTVPTEDGSALERGAAIVALPLADVLAHCRSGAIRDTKTEVGVRRLAEILGA